MKPIYWMFHLDRWLEERGHLRFRKRSLQPWRRGRLDYLARVDQKLVRTRAAGTAARSTRSRSCRGRPTDRVLRRHRLRRDARVRLRLAGAALPRRADAARATIPPTSTRSRPSSRRSRIRRPASRRSRCCARRSSSRGRSSTRRPSSSSSRTTSGSTSTRPAGAGPRRSSATRSSTPSTPTATRATTA